jgi:hypothetical protein
MPGYILHAGADVKCAHPGGQAAPDTPSTRVRVSGQAIVTRDVSYTITGCSHQVSGSPSPCTKGTWTSGAQKVRSNGKAVVLTTSSSTSIPNASPLNPSRSQTRVKAT